MKPYSLPVLAGATLVSSPALWEALVEGTTPLEVALIRYLVSVVLVWAMLALVSLLVGPAPQPETAADQDTATPPPD